MKNFKSYSPFVAVAVLAASIGWGASALTANRNQTVPATPPVPAANALQPVAVAPQYFVDPNANQQAMAPVAPAAPLVQAAPVAAPAVRRTVTPARVNDNTARETAREDVRVADENQRVMNAPRTLPVRGHEREPKRGMSNGTKTAIAIGGGAATGAAIGAIAGGGKGAAIGALIGGGGGAVYSVIRKKQGKEVW